MDAQPFAPSMAELIASWPTGPDECLAWCSADAVTAPDIVAWSRAPDVEAWVLTEGDRVVAYGEIWIDDDEGEVELAHLIVSPERRGRQVGRRLVTVLSDRGAMHHRSLVMRVRPENLAAQRCYAGAGYVRAPRADEDAWNAGQPVDYVWMLWTRPD